MIKPNGVHLLFLIVACIGALPLNGSAQQTHDETTQPTSRIEKAVRLENEKFAISIERETGVISSLFIKPLGTDILGEKRLAANFRICLPLEDYQANYIEGTEQKAVSVEQSDNVVTATFSGMTSPKGSFDLNLTCTITLEQEQIRFRAILTNHSKNPVSEFWFPRFGGWTHFDADRNAGLAVPEYINCAHSASLFKRFPGGRGFGTEAAEWSTDYPGINNMCMPWWDIYDGKSDLGLYAGYHDTTFRYSTWHTYLYPTNSGNAADAFVSKEQAKDEPVGLVFSHVRYPFIHSGETLDSGEFILRLHQGDWHLGTLFYRDWFLKHFPFDKSRSWLRKQSAWFTSIIYQPEDRIITDYKGYDQWTRDAEEFGINTFELIGWDKGGLERDYPQYFPEEKLGGKKGFRELLASINSRGSKCLVFVNYNILDSASDFYREKLRKFTHQDQFGNTPNWMAWGESTLIARKALSVRRHVLSSVVPEFDKLLEDYFLEIVRDGAAGFQIDKIVSGSALDFNPLNKEKPDVALCEGLVQAIGRLHKKCREINPDFCFASEAGADRFIPYVDVYYRASWSHMISPLRYLFPEWTSCVHVSSPQDYNNVNGAALTGAVICLEPDNYQASLAKPLYRDLAQYVQDVERIRGELKETVFLGKYYDTLGTSITEVEAKETTDPQAIQPGKPSHSGHIVYRVHGKWEGDRRCIVVANFSSEDRYYFWEFTHRDVPNASLYSPLETNPKAISRNKPLKIEGQGLHFIIEP